MKTKSIHQHAFELTALIALLFILCFCTSCKFSDTKETGNQPIKVVPAPGWEDNYNDLIYTEVYKTRLLTLDVTRMNFCPRWDTMPAERKAKEIANLFHGIAVFESDLQLNNRYVESAMGNDPLTHRQVASEGLLQLSYQDSQNYEGCKSIDWSKDKNLSDSDLNKTIFQPKNQFQCAIFISNVLMTKRNEPAIGVGSVGLGRYWSTVRQDHKFPKIKEKMISYGSECFL